MLIAALLAVFIVLSIFGISLYVLLMATWRRFPVTRENSSPEVHAFREAHRDELEKARAYCDACPWQTVEITSFDGLRLRGHYLPAEGASRAILLAHGYRSSALADMASVIAYYRALGFTILAPDLRGHGESAGNFVTFGVLDRFDIKAWCAYLNAACAPRALFLDGVSMGASAVLMSTGTRLPENVRGIIADCGFTGPWDEFAYLAKTRFRLPVFPFVHAASLLSRLIAGWGFRDYDAPRALRENHIPVFFAHGDADTFVPPYMTTVNYEACAAEKELFVVPGARHGAAFLTAREAYQARVEAFIKKYDV